MKALAIFQTALVMACLASPAAGQGMPENIRQQIDQHLIGRWSSQLDFDGKTTSERFTYRWANAKKKNSLLFSLTTEGYTGTQIGFWDAEKKHFVFQAQTSRGDHFVTVYDEFAEDKWSGHSSGIFDGKVWDADAAISWPDANSLHYEDITDGKPWVSKARRVAKSQPAGNFDEKKILAEVEAALRQWEAAFNAHDAVALSKLYDVKTDVIYEDDVHHRGGTQGALAPDCYRYRGLEKRRRQRPHPPDPRPVLLHVDEEKREMGDCARPLVGRLGKKIILPQPTT